MLKCVIEKGVPMPPVRPGRPRVYPFGAMVPGDSTLITGERAAIAASVAGQVGRTKGWRFVSRREGDAVRIWRVE